MANIIIFIGTIIVSISSYYAGVQKTLFDLDMKEAEVSSRCYSHKNLEAYVAKDGEHFACFKQNIDNKKISKSLIVMDENK